MQLQYINFKPNAIFYLFANGCEISFISKTQKKKKKFIQFLELNDKGMVQFLKIEFILNKYLV